MVSKRKKQQVPKVPITPPNKPNSPEALIRFNAELVETLFASPVWIEIVFPLLQESIASVSGRFTNGRFHQGTLTRSKENPDILRGYQLALEEFHNRLHDFILMRDKIKESKKQAEQEKTGKIFNPMMEDFDEKGNYD